MDINTKKELAKRINQRLEASLESMGSLFDALCEIQSNLYLMFHLLYIANKDIEDAVTIDVE